MPINSEKHIFLRMKSIFHTTLLLCLQYVDVIKDLIGDMRALFT